MTEDDVLFGYRQALFAEAARTNVSAACWRFGVHHSTYYAWKREVDRHGLEMLRTRDGRAVDGGRDRPSRKRVRAAGEGRLGGAVVDALHTRLYRRNGLWR